MVKLTISEIEAFNILADVIKSDFSYYKKQQDENIRRMYKILIDNSYTRTGAINSIYATLADKLNSMIEVRRTHIEDITKGIKAEKEGGDQ